MVSALESAVRGVYQFLYHHSKRDANVNEIPEAYNQSKARAPYGLMPADFDCTKPLGWNVPKSWGILVNGGDRGS